MFGENVMVHSSLPCPMDKVALICGSDDNYCFLRNASGRYPVGLIEGFLEFDREQIKVPKLSAWYWYGQWRRILGSFHSLRKVSETKVGGTPTNSSVERPSSIDGQNDSTSIWGNISDPRVGVTSYFIQERRNFAGCDTVEKRGASSTS